MADTRRVLVIDPLYEWVDSFFVAEDWETVLEHVEKPHFRVSLQLSDDNYLQQLERGAEIVLSEEVGNCTLAVDELSFFFEDMRGPIPSPIVDLFRRGRRQNVSVLLITQRPMDCPITLRGMLTDIYAFRSHEPRDIEYIGKIVGLHEARRIMKLRRHAFIHWDLREQTSRELELDR